MRSAKISPAGVTLQKVKNIIRQKFKKVFWGGGGGGGGEILFRCARKKVETQLKKIWLKKIYIFTQESVSDRKTIKQSKVTWTRINMASSAKCIRYGRNQSKSEATELCCCFLQ